MAGTILERIRCNGCLLLKLPAEFPLACLRADGPHKPRCRKCQLDDRFRIVERRRDPRSPRPRLPGIPPRPKLPARLSDDELVCLIAHTPGMPTPEVAYKVPSMSVKVARQRLTRLEREGLVGESTAGGWSVTEAGIERLRGLARG